MPKVCFLALAASVATASADMSAGKWRADVDVFARELPKRHVKPFHNTTQEQFSRAVRDLRAKAATSNHDEMLVGFMRVAAMIGDGHTQVKLAPGVHRLPIAVSLFGD